MVGHRQSPADFNKLPVTKVQPHPGLYVELLLTAGATGGMQQGRNQPQRPARTVRAGVEQVLSCRTTCIFRPPAPKPALHKRCAGQAQRLHLKKTPFLSALRVSVVQRVKSSINSVNTNLFTGCRHRYIYSIKCG